MSVSLGGKSELEEIRKYKMNGSYVRSRAQWINAGEKPSSYFLSLESNNYTCKIIPKLENEKGEIITDQEEILENAKQFYQNLYNKNKTTSLDEVENYINDTDITKLTDLESSQLEGQISFQEASTTLKNMKNNRSPGSDGFTPEFFKCFWSKLGHFVVRSINYGFSIGELSITQKLGLLTCIPKGDKPRHLKKIGDHCLFLILYIK